MQDHQLYLCQADDHNKMWSYTLTGDRSVRVEYGRIGLSPNTENKSFSSSSARDSYIQGKIRDKLKKQYILQENNQKLAKETKLANLIGHKRKIARFEYVAELEGSQIKFGDKYHPELGLLIAIRDSWSKETEFLLISKSRTGILDCAVDLESVHNYIYFSGIRSVNGALVKGILETFNDILKKVSVVVAQFGHSNRVLAFDDDEVDTIVTQIQSVAADESSAFEPQAMKKFVSFGVRELAF